MSEKMTICLDAGHYGKYNQSPGVKEYYESDMAWKLHLLQKKYFEEYDCNVITTRDSQTKDLALVSRGTKSKGCVLFMSNHSNAVGSGMNENVDYVAVYHLVDDTTTKCDDVSKEIAEKLAPVIAEVMGTKQGYKVLTRKAGNDRNGDGIMNDNYYAVLHGARTAGTPGLILEHSFHTNTAATKWLLDDKNLDALAKAEADVIAAHFGLKKEEKKAEKETTAAKEIYRVQAGAYAKITNAESVLTKIKAAGFDAYITKVGGMYKIQVGAYTVKKYAENTVKKLKAAGFTAFITKDTPVVVGTTEYYPKYTGNSYGIDTVLRTIGVPAIYIGTPKDRKPLAAANGIKSYTGTAKQNLKIITLAKAGKLKKV